MITQQPRELQTIVCNGIPRTEYRYESEVETEGAQLITTATEPLKANRYLVTLIHRYSGEEKLLDLLIDGQGFTAVMQEVRKFVQPVWELYEILDRDEPF